MCDPSLACLRAWQQKQTTLLIGKQRASYVINPELPVKVTAESSPALTLGRKNYLFAGSDAGGERAAVIYSLIGTAKLNGLDRIADYPINRIAELLPWNITATLSHAVEPAA